MKKLTREEKTKIDKQLEKEGYSQGGHTVYINGDEPTVIVVKGRTAHLPAGRKLPVPEEWWV
jgi:hypothetical protein